MINSDQIIKILKKEKQSLIQRWPIISLALFGSTARGEQRADSDVDLLVEFNGAVGWDFFDLESELERLLGTKVDLIPKSGIKPHYWERIAPDVIEVLHV